MGDDLKEPLLARPNQKTPPPEYGTNAAEDGSQLPLRKIIYCVHGKPSSGCCTVLEGDFKAMVPTTPSTTRLGNNLLPFNNHHQHKVNEHMQGNRPEVNTKSAKRKLIIASVLCIIFMIAEVIGGYLSKSLAIATDAAHLLTDLVSFMISLFSLWMASRPATRQLHFGWHRAEVIGALTSVLLIWLMTGVLVYMATLRIIDMDFTIDAEIMLITSAAGVAINVIMGLTLHQHGHTHSTGSSNQNINVKAAFIHVVGDLIQSIGVLVAAVIIVFKPEWKIVDPICTFLFSVLVVATTFTIIRDTVLVLMEGIPRGINYNEVMNVFLKIEGVVKVHNLRIWALSLDKAALSAHLAIRNSASPQDVLLTATSNIHSKYNFYEMTLQIEQFNVDMDFNQCIVPSI